MTQKHEVVLEPRAYGPDCTAAERKAIIARASIFSEGVILLRAVPIPNEFQTDLVFDEVERLSKTMGTFYGLVDLTESKRPDAALRQYVRERLERLNGLEYCAIYTGKNFLNNLTAQFIFGATTFRNFSVHKTQSEALLAIQKIKKPWRLTPL